jgi:hypothetical protein
MRCAVWAGREAAGCVGRRQRNGSASGMHGEGSTQALGARARAERTPNMPNMSLTPDVSQLEMSALKLVKLLKR